MSLLVTWTGYTSGSFMGRDDGYPETKMTITTQMSLDNYANRKDLKVYSLKEWDSESIEDAINMCKSIAERKKKEAVEKKQRALQKLSKEEQRLLGL